MRFHHTTVPVYVHPVHSGHLCATSVCSLSTDCAHSVSSSGASVSGLLTDCAYSALSPVSSKPSTIGADGLPVFPVLPAAWLAISGPPSRACARALGTYGGFCPQIQEEKPVLSSPPKRQRVPRYQLQSVARSALPAVRWKRLAGCRRNRAVARLPGGAIGEYATVDLMHVPEQRRAYYAHLQTCGSPWVCPPCSAAIYDRRRSEVAQVLDWARSRGKRVQLLTFTASHKLGEPLAPFLAALAAAMRLVFRHRPFERFKEAVGYIGSIKATEITYGANGWHAHFHALWISDFGTEASVMAFASSTWRASLRKVGLSASIRRGVVVKDSSWSADEYVAKFEHDRGWDLDAELTMWSRKVGSKGLSPWDLLRLGTPESLALYAEYAAATFGKSSIRFSPGLKELVGLTVVSDDQAAAAETGGEVGALLASLYPGDWAKVLANDCRGELEDIADSGDPLLVAAFLASIGVYLHDVGG